MLYLIILHKQAALTGRSSLGIGGNAVPGPIYSPYLKTIGTADIGSGLLGIALHHCSLYVVRVFSAAKWPLYSRILCSYSLARFSTMIS